MRHFLCYVIYAALFAFLTPLAATATEYFVYCGTPAGSADCSSPANACGDVQTAADLATSPGDIVTIEDDSVCRTTIATDFDASGTASNPITVRAGHWTGSNDGIWRLTQSVDITTGWTNAGGNVWSHSLTDFPGRGIWQDGANLGSWAREDVSCPSGLDTDQHYCINTAGDTVYLYSPTDPATRYTLVEALGPAGHHAGSAGLRNLVRIRTGEHYIFQDFLWNHCGQGCVDIQPTTTITALTFRDGEIAWSRQSTTRADEFPGGQGRHIKVRGDGTMGTLAVTRVHLHDAGRDTINPTRDTVQLNTINLTDVEISNCFNHGGVGMTQGGVVTMATFRNLFVHDCAGGVAWANAAGTQTGHIKTLHVIDSWFRDAVDCTDTSDTRLFHLGNFPNCGDNADALHDNGVDGSLNGLITVHVQRSIIETYNGDGIHITDGAITSQIEQSLIWDHAGNGLRMDDIGNSGNILRDTIIGTNATNQLTSNQADFFSSFTTLDHNQYYFPGANLATVNGTTYTTLGDWQAAGGGANSQAGDPLLVDPANDDWHLQAGSPAIGASSTGDDIGPFARVPTIASCEATDANTIDVTWSVPDWGGIYWTTAANYDAEENAVDLTETDAVVVNDILTRLTVSDTMTSGTTIVVKPLRGAVNTLDGIGVSTNLLRAINRADTTGVQCTNTIGSAPTAEITGLSAVSVSDTLDPDHTIDHLVDGCVATGPNCGVGNANLSAFSAVIDLGGASQDLTRLDLYGDDGGDWICSTWDAASCGTDSACAAPTSLFTGADCTGQQWFSQSFASVNTRYVQMTVTGQAEGTEVRELKAFEGATSVGILATPHVRFRKWGVAGETFTAVSTMRDGVEDGAVALAPGAKGHLRAKVACQDNPCDVTDFGFYACDGSCGTPSNWYAVGTTFGGKLLRRTSDPTVTSEGATTEQLTACTTFVSGAYLDDQAGAFPTFELTNGECTELVLVFELSALANVGDVVRINVQQGDGTDLQSTMDAQIDVTTSWVQW